MTPSGVLAVKSPEAFRTISEVATMLDVPQHVLRFWESRFPQIRPVKRAGGRRFYRPEDVDLLRGIRLLLYFEGYTIRGAQKVLREKGVRYTAALGREQAKNRRGGAEPGESVPVVQEAGIVALATLERMHEEDAEKASPAAGNPRHDRLKALRAELLDLKSRLAAARIPHK